MRKENEEPLFYRRNLPHFVPPEGIFFVTTCLNGALPKTIIDQLKDPGFDFSGTYLQKYWHNSPDHPQWLKNPEVTNMVKNAFHFYDGKRYELIAYCIMSNHFHLIFYNLTVHLSKIMHSLKSYTANEANKILNRKGKTFWHAESFDRALRDIGELRGAINYTLGNPLKAKLVDDWRKWEYSYISPDFENLIYLS